jgi:hypothetical protein
MKKQIEKLILLQTELKEIINDAQSGKLSKQQAADKIADLKGKIDGIVMHLKSNK